MLYQFKTNQLAQYQVRSCLELQWYTFSSVLIIGQIIITIYQYTRKMLHHPGASLSEEQIAFKMPTFR